jgi:hypothetical protein
MKQPTIIAIILIVAVAAVLFIGIPDWEGGVPGSVYSGRLKLNIVEIKRVDGSDYDISDSFYRVIHGSGSYNDKVADVSSDSVTGEIKPSDAGIWYLVLDYGTNTTFWLDHTETLKDPYITEIAGRDGDQDGFQETYLTLDFSQLAPLTAGESQKEREISLVFCPARTTSITFTSLTNASSIGTSAYSYKTATGYMAGFTEGDLGKIAKVELVFDDSGNTTYPDVGYWMLTHLKLGPYTWTATTFGGYDLANTRFQAKFGDQINSQGGKPIYYAKNAGDTWATYEVKAYCKYPSASKTIFVDVNLYFYKPDGTLTSAFTRTVSFAS